MTYKLSKPYRPIQQMPYCCVPATLQWILHRRGFDILDQEIIGVYLGLRLPVKCKKLFKNKDIIFTDKEPRGGYGTQIEKKKYSINNFFYKNDINLKISELEVINNKKRLKEFLVENFKANNDIVLRYNNEITRLPEQKPYGHLSVVSQFDEESETVFIGDSELPFLKKVSLDDILYSISEKIDGIQRGLYYVS